MLDKIFKAYDIRGVVPDELNADIAKRVGAAFASWSKTERVVVARDMREAGWTSRGRLSKGSPPPVPT